MPAMYVRRKPFLGFWECEVNDLRTFEKPGSDPPVVFLHGLFMDHTLWETVARRLVDVRVLTVDMPGHGDSPRTAPGATLDDHVALIADLFDSKGVEQALVVGHSWGGMIALRLAVERSDLVAGAVFCNTPVQRKSGLARLAVHLQRGALSAGLPTSVYGAGAARLIVGDQYRKRNPNVVEEMTGRVEAMGRWQLKELIRSVVLEPDTVYHLLRGLTIPWIAVAGKDDHEIPPDVADQLATIGDFRTAPGAHATPLEGPDVVAKAIQDVRDQIPTN